MSEPLYFLDLEQTLISSWRDPTPINLQLRNILLGKEVYIFSFAVITAYDLSYFNYNIRSEVKEAFGVKIKEVILMSQVLVETERKVFTPTDAITVLNEIGKQELFLKYISCKFSKQVVHFWDDMVEDLSIKDKSKNKITLHKV
jgi:hypothetical protein